MLAGAKKDPQLVTRDWEILRTQIEGVALHEVRHVPGAQGVLTELFRPEWDPTGVPLVHAYQVRLLPGIISAWHCHQRATDRMFVNAGFVKLVMYDDRADSLTRGHLSELFIGDARPTFVVIPPGVWHGVQNLGTSESLYVNFPTDPYDCEDPDHYRLPADADAIPYSWQGGRLANAPR